MKIKQALIVPALVMMMAPITALAVSDNGNTASNGNGADSRTTASEQVSQPSNGAADSERYCERVQTRLLAKSQTYNKVGEKHISAYTNMIGRLERFAANIKAKNYDTTDLEADIAVLKSKIAEFKSQVQIADQQTQKNALDTCSKSDDAVKASLALTRNRVRLSHQKAVEIRAYYKNVIRPDLLEIKAQYPGAVSNSTSTTSNVDAQDDADSTTAE